MKDSEIEDLLRKFRPVGPPLELRQWLFTTTSVPIVWPWVSAAIALLVSGLAFQLAARHTTVSAHVNLGPSAMTRVTEDLADMLGGDLRARTMAEFIAVEQQVHSEITGAAMEPAIGAGGMHQ